MKRKFYGFMMIFPVMALASCGKGPAPHVHSFGEWQQSDRDHFRTCQGCDEVERERHDFELVHTDPESCTDVEHQHWKCKVCDYEMIVDGEHMKDHSYQLVEKQASTCAAEGYVKYRCTECNEEYTVALPIDENAHKFDEGVKVDNVITYTCEHNHEHTKTRIDASEQRVADVHADDLKATGAIELETAAIAFDEEAMEEFAGDMSIAATPVEKETIQESLPENIAEKVGDNQIIDFSIKNSDEEAITSFAGKVTVTIPYTLKPGESAEGITILYLNGEESEAMEARYHDGEVTFETNHFSMYAVAHYDPEELCEEFGHNMMLANEVESTCKAHGYKEFICRRCNASEKEMLPLSTHDYQYVEKKDATTSEEGYVLYRCSKCNDEYKTVIERKSGTERGFYQNLLYSWGSKPIHLHGVETMNGASMPMDAYMGRDYDEEVYGYVNIPLAGMGEEEAVFYKGLTFDTSNLKADKGMAQKVISLLLNQYQSLMDQIPDALGDKLETVGEWIIDTLFTKTEEDDGGYTLSVSNEKIAALVQNVMTGTLGETITLLFGEGAIADIKSIAPWLYGHNVSDLIAWIENETGLSLEKLFNLGLGMVKSLGVFPAEAQLPSYNDIVGPYAEQDILELVASFVGKEKIPETAEELNEMVDSFLDMGIMEIVSMVMEMMPGSSDGGMVVDPSEPSSGPVSEPTHAHCNHAHCNHAHAHEHEEEEEAIVIDPTSGDISGMIMKLMSAMLQKVHVSIRTTAEGNFVSMNMSVDPMTLEIKDQREIISMTMLFTVGFDEAKVLNKINDLYELALTRDEMLTVNDASLPTIITAAKKATRNANFEFVEDYNGIGDALVANYTEDTHRKIVIFLKDPKDTPTSGAFNYDAYIEVMRNPDGIAGDIEKNGYGLQLEFRNFASAIYWEEDNGILSPWNPFSHSDDDYKSTYILMNLNNRRMFVKQNEYGRPYDYLNGHFFKYTVISKEEYPFGFAGTPQPGCEIVIIKGTCQNCGAVNYWFVDRPLNYNSNNRFSTNIATFLTPDMNRTAVDALTAEIPQFSWMSMNVDENNKVNVDYPDILQAGTYGNVTVSRNTRRGATNCVVLKDTVITVNNRTIVNNTYKDHNSYDYVEIRKPIPTTSSCEKCYAVYRKCNDCGKTYYQYNDYESTHTYEVAEWAIEGSATMKGLAHMVCTKCGEDYYTTKFNCEHKSWHYDAEKNVNVCDGCGVEMTYDTVEEYNPIILERYQDDYELGEMRFGFYFAGVSIDYAEIMETQYDFALANYSAYITYSYADSYSIVTFGNDFYRSLRLGYTYEQFTFAEEHGTGTYQVRRNYYRISLEAASDLEEEIRTEYPELDCDLLLTVVFVNEATGIATTIVL